MTDFLEQVVGERRADVERAKRDVPVGHLFERAAARGITTARKYGPRDAFTHVLWERRVRGRLAVIAEVKRISPALGALAVDLDVRKLARRYETAGAAAISVLTETRHWGGGLEDLVAVREAVSLPLLRKDVVVDEYQIVEAWAAGADAVLLIADALDDAALRQLVGRAHSLGIGVLVEAHETGAFGRAVRCGAQVVGVNARDLRRPQDLHPHRVRSLHPLVLAAQILVAESGIASVDDARLLPGRVDAVLVGTALMRQVAPESLIGGLSRIERPVGARA